MLQTVTYFVQQAMNCENAVLKGILTGLVVKKKNLFQFSHLQTEHFILNIDLKTNNLF